MNAKVKKWITFTIRWGIAVAGISWVLAKTPFHDRLMLVDANNQIVRPLVLNDPPELSRQFEIIDPLTGKKVIVDRADVWTKADGSVKLNTVGEPRQATLLAIRPGARHTPADLPAELLIRDPASHQPTRIGPAKIAPGGYRVHVPYPLVDIGVVRLVKHANLAYLLAALLVLPFSYMVTSRRWYMLLQAMDIPLSPARTFVLNMVGCFYNSFMPGSTGGDLIKAYYASKHTTHKVRAVLSVIVDRVVGLLALIMLGGIMAATQWHVSECRKVAVVCAGLIFITAAGLVVFYNPRWRRATGLDWLMKRLPMQRQVHHAIEAMELYGKHPAAPILGGLITFPVHLTAVLSAIFAGLAFGLKMPLLYYFTAVPVIVLVSAIPISPQGAGVMEVFAVLLTKHQGVTVSQAIALAMAIRFGQMFWNLVAGLFVLRGGYHAPTQKEQEIMETDEDEPPTGVRVFDSAAPRLPQSGSNGNGSVSNPQPAV